MGNTTGDRVRELHADLEQSVEQLVTGDDWRAMLETAARFHHYSPNNVMLILCQRPDATKVAGFRTWLTMGRHVVKGEHGIAILAPCVYKSHDDATDEDRRVVRGFKVAHVFDVAQTEGEDLADDMRPVLLEGEAPAGLWDGLAAQVIDAGFEIREPMSADWFGSANGTTSFESRVVSIRPGLSAAQRCKTLAHELAHVILHSGTEYATGCRGRTEVEAESVAFIVTAASGLATDGYSLPYVGAWAGGDVNVVRKTAERVMGAARTIIDALERDLVPA